jgi:hypothetical protein
METKTTQLSLILSGTAVIITIFVLVMFGFTNKKHSQTTPPPSKETTNITRVGKISCLPKRSTGPQTLECAIGLLADNGNYYALNDLFKYDPDYTLSQTDTRVEVTGTLTREDMLGPDGNPYDIAGVITINSIRKKQGN